MDELYQLFLQLSGMPRDPDIVRIANALAKQVGPPDTKTPVSPGPTGTGQTTATSYSLADLIAQSPVVREVAPPQTVATKASSSSSGDSDNVLTKVVKNVFGVAPIIGGLIDLFSGSDEPPPPLIKYAAPPSINFQAAETPQGLTGLDYDQSGTARAYPVSQAASPAIATPAPQITVNVQAMDARSFLDRSGDIALAVRDAMLNLNSINDIVNDL